MKTKLLAVICLFLNTFAFANSNEAIFEKAEALFEQEIQIDSSKEKHDKSYIKALNILTNVFENSDSILRHSYPKSGKESFLACKKSFEVQFVVGIDRSSCVAYSIDSEGRVDYIPATTTGLKIGYAAGASLGETGGYSVVKLNGVYNLRRINSQYVKANTGIKAVASAEMNWFQIGLSGAAKAINGDAGFEAGLRVNILNFDIQDIDISREHNIQSIQLPEQIIFNLTEGK